MKYDYKKYEFDDLNEEEASVIVSSLFRELHLVEGKKLYKSSLIRRIIEKFRHKKETDGPRRRSKLD